MNKLNNKNNTLKYVTASLFFFFLLFWVYKIRALGVIHGPLVFMYQYPVLWLLPVLGISLWLGVRFIINKTTTEDHKKSNDHYSYFSSRRNKKTSKMISWAWIIGIPTCIVWLCCALLVAPINNSKLASYVGYNKTIDIANLSGGEVRVKPYEVADAQITASFSSTTEEIATPHIILQNGKLVWTALRGPRGTWRKLTKPATGLVETSAETTAPLVKTGGKNQTANFTYSPQMYISQNTTWQIRTKFCYTCKLKEAVGVSTPNGPRILISYNKLKGNLFSKFEVFGGVFVVYPDGKIKQYSPAEALKEPMIVNSGRMFPEELARKYAEVFKYRLGVMNRVFSHKDGYEPIDTGNNPQPYLETFKDLKNPQWVTTMQPRGRAASVGLIMFTDAVTGETRIWRAPPNTPYLSNTRAINVVNGQRGPNGQNIVGPAFEAIEPRQVFPGGNFSYLISVVPKGNGAPTRVTLSVIVDARTQQVTRVFDASPEGDADLIAYLNGKDVGNEYTDENDGSSTSSGDKTTTIDNKTTVVVPKNAEEREKIIRELLKQNKLEKQQLEALLEK